MSEPEAGSDVGNVSCRAERGNGAWVVNGQKTWITGAHVADHILLVCRTSRTGNKHEGLTMLSVPREASMAKLKATEVAKRTALEGMQMMGGYGYATEYDMERHVRQTVVTTIYGGTSEIQKEIISRSLGL